MGIFDFVKDAGEKLGGRKSEAETAEAAQDERLSELRKGNALLRFVKEMGLPVDGLKIEFDDGVATVHGTVESQPVKENIILALGNTQGVSRVDDRMQVVTPAPEAILYTVKSGDTLGKIAKEQYGNAGLYPEIFEANSPMLTDPNKIYPGQVLRIPARD